MVQWRGIGKLTLFVAVCQGIQVVEVGRLQSLKALQWNLHSECFLSCNSTKAPHCDAHYPACQQNATSLVRKFLADVDFAGLEQLSDPTFFDTVDSELGHFQHVCGGSSGYGVYPFDLATLIFSSSWTVKEVDGQKVQPIGGCMQKVNQSSKENDYRAYVGQAFVHKETGVELIVLVAHYPHFAAYEASMQMLAADLAKLKQSSKVEEVLLLADTNQKKSNLEIIQDLDPEARNVVGSDLHITCCSPVYLFPYDRIIASNLRSMDLQTTMLPFGKESAHHVPDWATLNMHDPLLVEFHGPLPRSAGVRSGVTALAVALSLWQLRRMW